MPESQTQHFFRIPTLIAIFFLTLTSFQNTSAQNLGLSFSYFIPKNGYFSTPISPFSIRGIGTDLTRHIALETGASLYRMAGLSMKDLPMESKDPFVGPNFTIFIPAEIVFQFKGAQAELDLKGGVFGFYGFSQKLNYGNIDRAIRKMEGWEVANSTLTYTNKPGWGYHAGAEVTLYLNSQFGISLESNYLIGSSALPLKGSYTGGTQTIQTVEVGDAFKDGKIDFTGLEFSIGLIFNTDSGGGARRPAKRRR
jgi:hypothetical protein